jgi:transposase-like protein
MQNDYREKTPAEKREFWAEQIRLWQESGQSQSEYCRRHGIGTSQWFYWRRRCRDTETGLTLVPLKLPQITGIGGKTPAVRVITPNGFTIELDHDASRLSLPQLIREVAAI